MSHVTNLICNRELKASDIVCTHIYQVYKESAIDLVDPRLIEVMNYLIQNTFKDYCVLINNWSGNQSVEVMQKFPDVHYYEERGMRCNLCKSSLDRTKRGEVILEPHILGKAVDFTVYYKSGYQDSVEDDDVEKYQQILNEEYFVPVEEVLKMIENDSAMLPQRIRLDYSLTEWIHLDVLNTELSTSKILMMGNTAEPEIIDGAAKFAVSDIKYTVFKNENISISSPVSFSSSGGAPTVAPAKIKKGVARERAITAMKYLTSVGLTKTKAAALVGNFLCEGMRVDLGAVYNDGTGRKYEGPSAGIAGFHTVWKGWQYTYKSSRSEFETECIKKGGELGNLIKHCKAKGMDWKSLEGQLDYVANGSEAAKIALKQMNDDLWHSTTMWGFHYERFTGYKAILSNGYKWGKMKPYSSWSEVESGMRNYSNRYSSAELAYSLI